MDEEVKVEGEVCEETVEVVEENDGGVLEVAVAEEIASSDGLV